MKGFDDYKQHGFTLVEVMIAMLLSGIVISSIYSAFQSQQDSYVAQEQVAEMQQNVRSAMDFIVREIRMAGYDPTGDAGATIVLATQGLFNFTQDITDNPGTANDGDGDCNDSNENITFGFGNPIDADQNGIADAGAASLGRDTGGGFQAIAENIEAIEFNYIFDPTALIPTNADIRSVQVTILARAGNADQRFNNTMTYTTAGGANWGPFNDNFRRRLLTLTVQCRNMGLE